MGKAVCLLVRFRMMTLLLLLFLQFHGQLFIPQRSSADCFEWEVEYHGGGLTNPMVTGISSPDKCQQLCQQREGCNYFTWVNSQHDVIDYRNTCWLKSSQGNPQSCTTCVSGPSSCGSNPDPTTPSGCCEVVTISSTGDAPDYQWTRFGTYRYYDTSGDGRPMYKQEPKGNYLYYLDWLGVWYVNDNPLENMGGLINWGDAWCPSDIQEDWSFYRYGEGEVNDWEADPSIKVNCDSSNPQPPTTTTTTTSTQKPTTHTTHPNSEPCTWGAACNGCDVWAEQDGVRYCCANQCDWGDVWVWGENGEVKCECTH